MGLQSNHHLSRTAALSYWLLTLFFQHLSSTFPLRWSIWAPLSQTTPMQEGKHAIRGTLYMEKKWEEKCVFLEVACSMFSIKMPLCRSWKWFFTTCSVKMKVKTRNATCLLGGQREHSLGSLSFSCQSLCRWKGSNSSLLVGDSYYSHHLSLDWQPGLLFTCGVSWFLWGNNVSLQLEGSPVLQPGL